MLLRGASGTDHNETDEGGADDDEEDMKNMRQAEEDDEARRTTEPPEKQNDDTDSSAAEMAAEERVAKAADEEGEAGKDAYCDVPEWKSWGPCTKGCGWGQRARVRERAKAAGGVHFIMTLHRMVLQAGFDIWCRSWVDVWLMRAWFAEVWSCTQWMGLGAIPSNCMSSSSAIDAFRALGSVVNPSN